MVAVVIAIVVMAADVLVMVVMAAVVITEGINKISIYKHKHT
jgi:hypothetical protein